MKKLFLFVLLFIAFGSAFSQTGNDTTKYLRYYEYGIRHQRIWADSVVNIPSDTLASKWGLARKGQNLFLGNGIVWTNVTGTGGGGGVTSYIGRTGVVTALSSDYSSFYPQLSIAYSDPSWINSLSASKISSPGSVSAGSSKVTLGGVPTGASLQNFSIDVVPANILLSTLGGALGISQISATGSPSSSTFLRGDGTWSSASGGGITSSNIGTGYRWVIPFTGSTKTLFTQSYLLADSSSNTNGLTIGADTSAGKLATKTDIINIAPYAASNGLNIVGRDVQLGGYLTKPDSLILTGSNTLKILDSGTSGNTGIQILGRTSSNHGLLFVSNLSSTTATEVFFSNSGTGSALSATTSNAASTSSTVVISGNQTAATGGALNVSSSGGSSGINATTSNSTTAGAAIMGQSVSSTNVPALYGIVTTAAGSTDTAYGLRLSRNPSGGGRLNADISIASYLSVPSTGTKMASLVRTRETDTTNANFTTDYHIGLANAGVAVADKFVLSGNGKLQLNKYGVGSFLGVKAYGLAIDASGNIIEDTTAGGGGGGASLPFFDNVALIKNISDPSKLLILGAANISTGTTRTIQSPNASGTITLDNNTSTLTNKTIDAASNTISNLANSNLSGSAAISNANLATFPGHTRLGNITGSTAAPTYVTQAQETADLNLFTTSTQGMVPSSTGGTVNYLRADGTWTDPTAGSDTFTLRTPGTGAGAIPLAFTNAGALVIPKIAPIAPVTFTVAGDSLVSIGVDTSAGLTHLATQAYVLANGGSGSGVALDVVTTITSGTSSTVPNGTNVLQFNPTSVIPSYTLTLPTTWHNGKVLYIVFTANSTITNGNTMVTNLTIVNGSGQTLSQVVPPTAGIAGQSYTYKLIGTVDQLIN